MHIIGQQNNKTYWICLFLLTICTLNCRRPLSVYGVPRSKSSLSALWQPFSQFEMTSNGNFVINERVYERVYFVVYKTILLSFSGYFSTTDYHEKIGLAPTPTRHHVLSQTVLCSKTIVVNENVGR